MLKWEYYEQGYCAKAECEFGEYRAFSDGSWWGVERGGESRDHKLPTLDYSINQIELTKAACDADYARRVAEIALANGYIKPVIE